MTFEIKIQNIRQFSTWLCSVTIAQILQIIRRKSSAKRKFTGSTAHFIEKRVYSQRHTREGKTFILAKTRRESRRPVNPIITMRETPFSSSITSIGTFRFDYEYEIEYEYEFLNLVFVASITACHTNVVSWVSLSAGKQRKEARVLGM